MAREVVQLFYINTLFKKIREAKQLVSKEEFEELVNEQLLKTAEISTRKTLERKKATKQSEFILVDDKGKLDNDELKQKKVA